MHQMYIHINIYIYIRDAECVRVSSQAKKIQNLNVSGFPINNAQTEWAQIKMPHATVIPS